MGVVELYAYFDLLHSAKSIYKTKNEVEIGQVKLGYRLTSVINDKIGSAPFDEARNDFQLMSLSGLKCRGQPGLLTCPSQWIKVLRLPLWLEVSADLSSDLAGESHSKCRIVANRYRAARSRICAPPAGAGDGELRALRANSEEAADQRS